MMSASEDETRGVQVDPMSDIAFSGGLSIDKKADILLQLHLENRKQAEWVKELDFKVVYSTLGVFIGAIFWLGSKPATATQRPIVAVALGLVAGLALIFLARNHARHISLNHERARV